MTQPSRWPDGRHCEPEIARAIDAYRKLQESNGGDTRAGAKLGTWLEAAGFGVLSENSRLEDYESPADIGEYLAYQLESAGAGEQAMAMRRWAAEPTARVRQCWRSATAIR